MKTLINWKVFFILLVAVTLTGIAVLPYAVEVQSMASAPVTFSKMLIAQLTQGVPFVAVLIFLGMILMKHIGLSAPILDAVTKGEYKSAASTLRRVLPISVVLGVVATLLLIGLGFVLQPLLVAELHKAAVLRLERPAACGVKGPCPFSGGIVEEIQLRLFFMSLLAWLGSFISRTSEGKPSKAIFWIANILAAVLFGVGHLQSVALFVPLTALVIFRTVLLNAIIGVICGWLYQKRGLESAMISHFTWTLFCTLLAREADRVILCGPKLTAQAHPLVAGYATQ
jgi:hypothetical protein